MKSLIVLAIVLCVSSPVFAEDKTTLEFLEKEVNDSTNSPEKFLESLGPLLTRDEREALFKRLKELQGEMAEAVEQAKKAEEDGDEKIYRFSVQKGLHLDFLRLSILQSATNKAILRLKQM